MRCLGIIVVCFMLAPWQANAEDAAWQLGVGLAYSQLPDYPGAAGQQHYLLPFPYFTYRSDKVKLTRSEALGQLFSAGKLSLNLSLAAALPVNSDDNQARRDMPDLLWLTEIGPTADYQLLNNDRQQLLLRLPLRKAIATDLRQWHDVGWRLEPQLHWRQKLANSLQWTSQLALNWSDKEYHQYLYGVAPAYATATRQEYRAQAGYAGWRWSNGISWQHKRWWLGAFVRYDNLQGVSFADSPLLQRQHNASFGVALAWIFNQQGYFDE
ncbi:MAG: MipA/OmpV family protein [Gammaproteobacteria bacterium]|nr:MipA/OmpV family protein [Gammaproteobacteria bacterium]MBU2181972.1 MipA/OmpV family protein [Gammaproteobacteria bacterium]MBU2207112.1 MipA/OmpV family protein [Gammaproteobacteria bacterium]